MPVLARSLTYAVFFIGLVLVFVPARLLSWSGIDRPAVDGPFQFAGLAICVAGAVLALWCVLVFALKGEGTPAPFDPPRKLVVRGPYRLVRNPMYVGAGLSLFGAALFHESVPLTAYSGLFYLAAHLFVLFYEEPRLERHFGAEYTDYRRIVGQWFPRRR